jgi:hypothetical protein
VNAQRHVRMKLAVRLCVDPIGGKITGEPMRGAAEMRELALSVLAALDRADLADVARTLHDRMFGCDVNALLESYEENSVVRWRFKPMAELLLRELKQLATVPGMPIAERRRRIEWTFDMAGF